MRRWPRWRDAPRWLKRTFAIFGGLVVLVPLLTNVVLWLNVVPRLLNADGAAISYRFAWAPWPTRIKLYDLLVTGQDPNIQFAVRVEECWLTVELWATATRRTLTISKVRGSGASVRVLQRLQPWAVSDAKVKALPDIPGRTKPPITDAYVKGPPATREHYDKISLDVRDIDAMAKELWVDEARYRGNVHVTGAFLFRPGLELHIGPGAAADVLDGELGIAGKAVLTKLEGRAEARTPYFNPVEPEGVAILRFFSGSLSVRGALVGAEFANYFLAPEGIEVHGGAGHVRLKLAFERGVVLPGTNLEVESHDLHATAARTRFDTSLKVAASFDPASNGTVRLTTDHLSLGPLESKARLSGGELDAQLASTEPIDLAKPLPAMRYEAALSPLSGDIAAIRPYVPKSAPLTFDAGRLSAGGEVSGMLGKPDLRATLQLKAELTAHSEQRRFDGKLSLRGRVAETRERLDFTDTKLAVSDLMVAKGKDVTYGWWTEVEVLDGGVVKGSPPRLDMELVGRLRDIEPLYVAFGKDIGVPAWVQGLLPLPNTGWRGHLAVEAETVRVSDFRAKSGTEEVLLKLRKPPDEEPSGAVKLASGLLSFGVAFSAGQTHNQPFATEAWFQRQN
jgi:hypothetical protein